jgi:prepilin-type N-terminal cleavage/methylation domain-containing protein
LHPAGLQKGAFPQQHRQAGFTIAEVAVAAAVLTIVALGFYTALSSGFLVLQSSRENLRATQVMMQKLEGIRLCTWSELTNFTFAEPYNPLSTNNSGVTYKGNVTIGPATNLTTNPSYQNNMCLVTVSLNWTNSNHGTPVPHTRQMQSEVARYGLQNYIWGAIK